jgi:hypothetical protein
MRFALRNHASVIAFVAAAVSAQSAFAEDAFIRQATGGTFSSPSMSSPLATPSQTGYAPSRGGTTGPTPETSVPASGGNFAGTLEMGRNNYVIQAQNGGGNKSNVGIIGGSHDNVGVFQHGKGLVSNLALVGLKGFSVDIIQRPDSGPLNMLIGRGADGALNVVQPKGAPPVNLVRVPGGLVVVR